ncbi:cyanate lyase [Catenulispora sp. EB89]|uniref:helix-turn-helix domain-containing protein n=1 Tax=Catenulispora sp. EB89 TaxID=3156257 RepID=UPI0035197BA7
MTASTGAQERMLSELERLKVRAGMSFAQLQSAVPYSRSALHRYFTGQSPIPRDAVVAVVHACGGDEAAMVRMWEAASPYQLIESSPR